MIIKIIWSIPETNSFQKHDSFDFAVLANDDLHYRREQAGFMSKIEDWMNSTSDRLTSLEAKFAEVDKQLGSLVQARESGTAC